MVQRSFLLYIFTWTNFKCIKVPCIFFISITSKQTMRLFYFIFRNCSLWGLGIQRLKLLQGNSVITNQSKTPVKFDHNSATDFLNTGTPVSFIYCLGFTTSQNIKTLKKHIWVLAHCYSKLSSKDKDSNEAIYLGKQFSSAKRAWNSHGNYCYFLQ